MRHIERRDLDDPTQEALRQKQAEADRKRSEGALVVDVEWQNARRSAVLTRVMGVLREMAGKRERCMYCLDSHGTDVEHFWPKTPYPERMFDWHNLLLCCTECGRFKGDRFPLAGLEPLLIDPTVDEPWQYLDFDPTTGNIVARFDAEANEWLRKGLATVEVLQLDRREALAEGYRRTFRRLARLVERYLGEDVALDEELALALRGADDHGLLGWCLLWNGQNVLPFSRLRVEQPEVWAACISAMQ